MGCQWSSDAIIYHLPQLQQRPRTTDRPLTGPRPDGTVELSANPA